ncbi:hypothetical protein D3C76_1654070 [compost metagenome]
MGQLLGAVVAARQPRDTDLADTERLHIAQVLLQHQAPERQFVVVDVGQQGIQLIELGDHLLPAPGTGQHGFEPQWPFEQH